MSCDVIPASLGTRRHLASSWALKLIHVFSCKNVRKLVVENVVTSLSGFWLKFLYVQSVCAARARHVK